MRAFPGWRFVWATSAIAVMWVLESPVRGGSGPLLDPSGFASLGQLSGGSATYTFNTGGTVPVLTISNGSTIEGVIDGVVDPVSGAAVFDFSSIQLNFGDMEVQGYRPLALLSAGNITINGFEINASATGSTAYGQAQSTPGPGATGVGGGYAIGGGGGGGYGSPGGAGAPSYSAGQTFPGGAGGGTYGGPMSPLEGGSSGGSSSGVSQFTDAVGGAGGGAIEIGALGNLTLNNTVITANGGNGGYAGGGGSGGEIVLMGATVGGASSSASVAGGDGGPQLVVGGPEGYTVGQGGYGGGGIIEVAGNWTGGIFLEGTSAQYFVSTVPEPSSIFMAMIAIAGGAWCARMRR